MTTKRQKIFLLISLPSFFIFVGIITKLPIENLYKVYLISSGGVAYLSIIHSEMSSIRAHFADISNFIKTSGRAKVVYKYNLYSEMINALSQSSEVVYVTYFNKRGPKDHKNVNEIKYHDTFDNTVTTNRLIDFKRIIAISTGDQQSKRDWVKHERDLCNLYPDNDRIRYVIVENYNNMPYFNIQIFDGSIFIIDPCRTHDDIDRDMYLASPEIVKIWKRYYTKIWDSPEMVKDLPAWY